MRRSEEAHYRDFVVARLDRLRRTAYLLCRNWHTADDLVSITLTKLYRNWRRANEAANLDAYVRGILANAWVDESRRSWRREDTTAELPEIAVPSPSSDAVSDRTASRSGASAARRAPPRFWGGPVNDTDRKLLEDSIIESMPPFPSVDGLISAERRRQRLRRGVGIIAIAAAVAGVVFAVQVGVPGSPTGGATVGPRQSGSAGTGTPTQRSMESTVNRLDKVLRARLSTVVPGVTYTTVPNQTGLFFIGLEGFTTTLSVTTSQGTGIVELTALWSTDGSSISDNLGRFACVGLWAGLTAPANPADAQCEERTDEDGRHIALAQWREGSRVEYVVAVQHSDDTIVRISARNNPDTGLESPVLTLSQLRTIIADASMAP